MANTIKIKAGNGIPTTSDIVDKELAFDRDANKLYINDNGTIVDLSGSASLDTEAVQDIVGAMFSSNTETRISATYQDSDGTIDLVVDDMTADTNTQLSTEQVQDIVGAMFSGNTETRITATYQDSDGTIDLVVDDLDTDTQLTTENVQDIVGAMFSSNTETRISATYQDGDGTIDLVVDDMTTDTNTNQLTTFTLTADSGSNQTIAHGNTLDIAGGTGISTSVGATDTVTVNLGNHSADLLTSGTVGTARLNVPSSGDWFSGGASIVATDGVMEIGRYIDFHNSDTTTDDYHIRLDCESTSVLNVQGGTLEVGGSQVLTAGDTIDISSQTNLSAGTNITLSGDTLNVDDAFIKNNANDTSSGTITAAGLTVSGSNALTLPASHYVGKIVLYSGGNEKIGTEANTILFTADNHKFKDTNGDTNVTFDNAGEIAAASLDISGDIDVDGTANFDAIDLDGNLDMRADDVDAARYIHMPRGGGITFYGDASQHHGIFARNDSNTTAQDDILITSYGAVYIDLDSNDNNTSNASFEIGRHNTANDPFFVVDGEDGQVQAEDGSASAPAYSFTADQNSGMFRVSSDVVGIAAAGNSRFTVKGNGIKAVSGSLGVNTDPNSTDGMIHATNDIVAFSSDKRLKENIRPIENALDKVSKLSGFVYNWNELANEKAQYDMNKDYVGVYAQDVEEVQPEAVDLAPFDNDGEDKSISGDNYLTVQYEKLVPLLIESIKELKAEIEELKK